MITIVEGRGVGAGKSYYVATRILVHLSRGGTVYAADSFGLKWPETKALVAKRYGLELDDSQYVVFPAEQVERLHEVTPQGTAEMPILIVVDEAHTHLNARDWSTDKKSPKRKFFNWLTQSRHDDCDLIFISQHAANMDRMIARLVTYIIRLRNMTQHSIPGLGAWPFKQFMVNRYDQDGKTLMKQSLIWHDKEIFAIYNSKVMRGAHVRLDLTVPKKQLNKVKKQNMSIRIILFLGLLVVGGYLGYQQWNKPREVKQKEKEALPKVVSKEDKPKGIFGTPAPSSEAIVKPAYSIISEAFRATDTKTYVRTDVGTYTVGQMSGKGFVEGLKGDVVRIRLPDGGLAFVVAELKTVGGQSQALEGEALVPKEKTEKERWAEAAALQRSSAEPAPEPQPAAKEPQQEPLSQARQAKAKKMGI